MLRFLLVVMLLTLTAANARAGEVVVSIKPLHSLVAGVMEGDDQQPQLLVNGQASLHSFVLKPSQMEALSHADIVFYMGDSFEMFLDKALDSLPSSIERVPMEKAPGMTLYKLRLGNGFEPHEDGDEEKDEHHHHDEGMYDLHAWTSPANAKAMVDDIVKTLAEKYPKKRALYEANGKKLQAKLDQLDAELQARMQPLQGKEFIVFHDAYQYFEKAYHLTAVGSITLHPERGPSAKRISDIRKKVKSNNVACVFREPQFDGRIVDNLLEGTHAKSAVLDPEAALIAPGPELYFTLMNNLANGFAACLR